MMLDLAGLQGFDDPAMFDEKDAIGEILGEGEVLLHKQDRHAATFQHP